MRTSTKTILATATVLLLSIVFFEYSGIDLWLQDQLYNFETGQWILDRNETVSKLLFYDGIKRALIAFVLLIIVGAILFSNTSLVQNCRQGLVILVLSAVLVPVTVGALKATTNVPCPRDLEHYGGSYPHATLLKSYPDDFQQKKNIRCYPAGHASGGFALLSLVFLFKRKGHKAIAAVSALSIGWAMGIYKMLIGDHFLGHTFVTMVLAWLIVLLVANSVYGFANRRRI